MWNAKHHGWPAVALIVAVASAAAQENPRPSKFDVTSVKPVITARDSSRTNIEHGSLTATNITIRGLIRLAFDVRDYQILNAPGWIDGEHYDIAAKAAAAHDFTDKEMEPLIQDLLKDRFGFRYRRDTRNVSGYALLVAESGARLKAVDKNAPPGTSITTHSSGKVVVDSKKMSMTRLAVVLESLLKQPVTNDTGLAGDYAVQLEFDAGLNPDSSLPSVFTAMKELGLRLQTGKVPVAMILLEEVRRPSEN
jgi:uncharacterized protein (TIGR03435 family)